MLFFSKSLDFFLFTNIMNINQQLISIMEENHRLHEENINLKKRYENLLEEHKVLQLKCCCGRSGPILKTSEQMNILELENCKLNKMVKDLQDEISLLNIQLTTYKEDFLMERKDREAAQDRVIKLEQELSDLCSGKCSSKSPRTYRKYQIDDKGSSCPIMETCSSGRCQELSDTSEYEIVPTPSDMPHCGVVASDLETQTNFDPQRFIGVPSQDYKMGNAVQKRPRCIKNIMEHIKRKSPPSQARVTSASSAKPELQEKFSQYEYDCLKSEEVQLRGRSINTSQEKSFDKDNFYTLINKVSSPEEQFNTDRSLLNSSTQIFDSSDVRRSPSTSFVKVMPKGSSEIERTNVATKNFPCDNMKPVFEGTKENMVQKDSDDILRCPACMKTFKALTEHYKLLQHMDTCGQ